MAEVGTGTFVLADISGYTSYLSGVELEHSSDVLADLIGVVVEQMRGTFRLAKLEGDAIFCYTPEGTLERSGLVDMIDSSYFAFAHRLSAIGRATTCECKACSRIPSLNLKFVAHHGSFAEHNVAGSRELVGSDVIVAHRLLKNTIKKTTGIEAYAFFTEAARAKFDIDAVAVGMRPHTERTATGWVLDLAPRWEAERERRVVYVGPGEGMFEHSLETTIPPPLAWEYCTNPKKLEMWWADKEDLESATGLMTVGATTHCVHGNTKIDNEIVDWRPYKYYTYVQRGPLGAFLCTNEIVEGPAPGRWLLVARVKPLGGWTQRLAMRVIPKAKRLLPDAIARLDTLLKTLEGQVAATAAAEAAAKKPPKKPSTKKRPAGGTPSRTSRPARASAGTRSRRST